MRGRRREEKMKEEEKKKDEEKKKEEEKMKEEKILASRVIRAIINGEEITLSDQDAMMKMSALSRLVAIRKFI